MNCEEFNEASDYLHGLENLLVKSGKVSASTIVKEQMVLIEKNRYLINELCADNYLADYNYYLSNLMRENKVEYER
jgi:hypothetical protein